MKSVNNNLLLLSLLFKMSYWTVDEKMHGLVKKC